MQASEQEIALAPLRTSTWWWLWIPLVLTMLIIAGTALLGLDADAPPALLLAVPLVALVGAGLSWALRRRSLRLEDRALQVVATLYRRTLSTDSIDLAKARVISFAEHTEFKPLLKTNGFNLPGFHAGNFRLRNMTKAFCLVTDPAGVLMLPLRDGSVVLLSPEKPRELLQRLGELAKDSARR